MTRRRWTATRVANALWLGASGFGVVAAALLVWPATPRVPSLERSPSRRLTVPSVALATTDGVVRADLFAPGHVPPRTRWAPPPIDTMPPGLAPDPTAVVDAAPIDPPRFYGTVIDARGAAALLRFPGASDARLFHAGEGARGWRVVAVAVERVTVADPEGVRLTLRLPRGDRASSSDTTL